ncbi:MAG: hydroxyectoine utilization dehydratase EutB [Paracoccaceae bacterium]
MMTRLSLSDVELARETISPIAIKTPFLVSGGFSASAGQEVLLKLESMQPIGAFKLRGAANAILNLPERTAGVVCCSTGNHGRGVAFAARRAGMRAVVCLSALVPGTKIDGIRALGAEVRIMGQSQDDAQAEVARLVASEGLVEVSPFDDPYVIAGQGTIALEMLAERPDLGTVIVPLSGGGLAGGIALAAKALKPSIRVIGVTMDTGPAMYHSIRAGHPVEVREAGSLADSLGGGIMDDNRLTLDLCTRLLDETLLVSEEEIYHAMQALFFDEKLVAEGAACVGLAALLAGRAVPAPGPVGVVVSGRNVDAHLFADIIAGRDVRVGTTRIVGRAYDGH